MASAAPVRSSIDHPSSDSSGRPIPWSQVVRAEGDGKAPPPSVRGEAVGKQCHQQKKYFQEHNNKELRVDFHETVNFGPSCSSADSCMPVAASSEATSSSSSSCTDDQLPLREPETIISMMPGTACINSFFANETANVNTSNGLLVGTLGMDEQTDAGFSRPAWNKPLTRVDGTDPGPIMGAMSWPALSAVRSATKSAPPVMEVPVTEGLPFRIKTGNSLTLPQQKQPDSHHQYRIGLSSSHENTSDISSRGVGSDHVHQSAKVPHFPAAAAVNDLGSQQRAETIPAHFPTNMMRRRAALRDYGRGNHGWNSVGRGNAYGRNGGIQLQHQRVGPRNMRFPAAPFIGSNLGLVPFTGLQNPSGGIYYMPTPPPGAFFGAVYYGVPGYPMPAPESMNLDQRLLKQIEYYFSVDNLCKDIYLRSHMDSQGFVPVGVIASFNRVRSLSQNPNFILDVLRESTVVEVQGEGIRKRDGWMQWLPQPSWQLLTNSSVPPDDNRKELVVESAQEEDSIGKCSRFPNESQVTEAEMFFSKTSSVMDDFEDGCENLVSSSNLWKSSRRMSEEPGNQVMAKSAQFGKEQSLTQAGLNGSPPRHHNEE